MLVVVLQPDDTAAKPKVKGQDSISTFYKFKLYKPAAWSLIQHVQEEVVRWVTHRPGCASCLRPRVIEHM